MKNVMRFCWFVCLVVIGVTTGYGQIQIGQSLEGASEYDLFGYSTALSYDGQVMAIASPQGGANVNFEGLVETFLFENGKWSPLGEAISGNSSGDFYGKSMALSSDGKTMAFGAGNNYGFAKVFSFENGLWSQKGEDIGEGEKFDKYGWAVDISSDGSTIAVGIPQRKTNGTDIIGAVEVYKWVDDQWKMVGEQIKGEGNLAVFGTSVSLNADGSILAVGAPGFDEINYTEVYTFKDKTWELLGKRISGGSRYKSFGHQVRLSEDGLRLALMNENNSLHSYKFEKDDWQSYGGVITRDDVRLGYASSMDFSDDGNRLLVGNPFNEEEGKEGSAQLFKLSQGEWIEEGKRILGPNETAEFGTNVCLSGNGEVAAVTSPEVDGESTERGMVQTFTWMSTSTRPSIENDLGIALFPNPTQDLIHFSREVDRIQVINSEGIVVLDLEPRSPSLDLSTIQTGFYKVIIHTEDTVLVKSLIKE